MNSQTTLVATLGGKPEVITFTLDLLLARGESIEQVVLVYLATNPRYQQAYRQVAGEFAGDRYAGAPGASLAERYCHLRGLPVRAGSATLADARTPEEVEAVRRTFFDLLADLKAQEQRVHLSLTGGRRILALTALAAAMRHLTPADRIWHISTPPEIIERARGEAMMHAPPGSGVQLIEVPFVPWAAYFPGLRPLLERPPQAGRAPAFVWQDEQERERCRQVWEALSPRQRDVLRVLASGQTRPEAAAQLDIAPSTLDSHRAAILAKCQQVWGLEGRLSLDSHFLRECFGPFLAQT